MIEDADVLYQSYRWYLHKSISIPFCGIQWNVWLCLQYFFIWYQTPTSYKKFQNELHDMKSL